MIMKTLCDDKENINRKMQQEHGPPLTEMVPLLTSLHENEAEKTGLLGNKMALYEQFTVSPHRFAQSCTPLSAPISCSEQSLLKEYHHLSPLSHMPSSLPSSRAQKITCQFFGTTTVCKNKPMDGLGHPLAAQDVLLDTEVKDATGSNLKRTASKTADEFVFSQPSNHTSSDKTMVTSPMLGQGICDNPPADVMKVVEGAQYLSLGDGRWSVSESNQEEGCTCMGSKSGKAVTTDKEPLTVLKYDQDTAHQEQDQDAMIVLSGHSCLQKIGSFEGGNISQPKRSNTEGAQFDRPCTNDVQVPGQCCSDEERMDMGGNDLDHLKESSHDARTACGSICKIESGSALPGRYSEVPKKTEDSISPILDTTIGENTHRITNQSSHFSVRDKCGACENNCKCGIVESSQHDIEIGDSPNYSESDCALPLLPKAVIQAVGQLRFWKVRLALIRQQRMFSDQVFELHKLIEVQRLMAGASNILIDDIYFCLGNINTEYDADALVSHSRLVDKEESGGAWGKQVSASKEAIKGVGEANNKFSNQPVDKEEGNGEALGKQVSASKEAIKGPVNVGEANTKVSTCQAHLKGCPDGLGFVEAGASAWRYPSLGVANWSTSLPAQTGACTYPPFAEAFRPGSAFNGLGFVEAVASAWRYPSLGVANWSTSLPGQTGACTYPPFAEAFRPGSAFGNPFMTAVLGPEGAAVTLPPIFPYGFPVCLQRRQPTPASIHQQHSAPYHSVFDPSGPRPLNKRHWAAEIPTVSVASFRSQPDMSRHQIKSTYPFSLNAQLHKHEKEMQPGRKGLTAFGSQAEDIQHTAMGSIFNTSTVRPHNDTCEHSEQGSTQALNKPHHGYDVEQMSRLSWERQKEKKQKGPLREVLTGPYVDVNTSLKPSMSALNLFPLAPILSLDEHDKRRSLRGGKEWQGHAIKVVPRAARSTPEATAGILLSIQQERKP